MIQQCFLLAEAGGIKVVHGSDDYGEEENLDHAVHGKGR